MKTTTTICGLMFVLSCSSAFAADYNNGYLSDAGTSFLSELRMGVMYHDVERREKGTVDLQAEVLLQPFGGLTQDATFWDRILAPPRPPHIGVSVNTGGGYTSYAYAGASWLFPIYGSMFIETSFGGAVHDGELKDVNPKREPLGTRALFRETASLGFDYDRLRFMVTVEHLSNAGLGKWNHGLTQVGGRVGYKF